MIDYLDMMNVYVSEWNSIGATDNKAIGSCWLFFFIVTISIEMHRVKRISEKLALSVILHDRILTLNVRCINGVVSE